MRTALLLLLLPSIAGASGTRLARCDSGKAGTLQLFVTRDAQGNYALSSRDSAEGAEARVLTGQVTRITHRKLDARHHVYRLELEGGALQQAAGLDAAHCQDEGARARCAVTAVEVKLAKGGTQGPGDDGLSALQGDATLSLDNGGPQRCTVYASKALTALMGK